MTVKRVDSGGQALGTLTTLNFKINWLSNNLNNQVLPTTIPATPQISFTIDNSVLPVLPFGTTYKPSLAFSCFGQNTSGVAATVSYDFRKNGVSIATGTSSSVPNNSYWTLFNWKNNYSAANNPGNPGDLIEVYLYANNAGMSLNAFAVSVVPDSPNIPAYYDKPLADLTYTIANVIPDYSASGVQINFNTSWMGGIYLSAGLPNGQSALPSVNSIKFLFSSIPSSNGVKWFSPQNLGTIGFNVHATYYPDIQSGKYASSITFREVL